MPGKHLSLLVHFVWSTASRAPLIAPEWHDRLYGYIGGVLKHKRSKLICAGGVSDHIHVYASLPSTVTVAEMVNVMKANSSRWIHKTFSGRRAFAWQEGYGAFSVSQSAEARVIEYIHNQETHHRHRDFKTEFLAILKKHRVEYDERYLWD
ncbi:MAG: IS200/IS605 family transposase [Acidobacteria bacterium]|nr:IS200/IS605 family transposase [Acidobacteriota bacterium]MBI3656993.1 IS200/IS605 family transposase [Acidobacteriota bacterium]